MAASAPIPLCEGRSITVPLWLWPSHRPLKSCEKPTAARQAAEPGPAKAVSYQVAGAGARLAAGQLLCTGLVDALPRSRLRRAASALQARQFSAMRDPGSRNPTPQTVGFMWQAAESTRASGKGIEAELDQLRSQLARLDKQVGAAKPLVLRV